MRRARGFTLVELMIVIAIIGVLAAIAVPQFMKYRTKAYNAAAKHDLRVIQTAVEMFYDEWGEYPHAWPPKTGKFDLIDRWAHRMPVQSSKNVWVSVIPAPWGKPYYAIGTKHQQGDTIWLIADSRTGTITKKPGTPGKPLGRLDVPFPK